MSAEILVRGAEVGEESTVASALIVGRTVFERLALDARTAEAQPESEPSIDITNSVTRYADGQTVPDE